MELELIEGQTYRALQDIQDSCEIKRDELFKVIYNGSNLILRADSDGYYFRPTRWKKYFTDEYFALQDQFKIGDLVIGTEDNPYGFTNKDALMKVIPNEGLITKMDEWDICIEVIDRKDKSNIGSKIAIQSRYLKPYQNGILDWLHDPSKREVAFTADDIPF